MTGARLGTSDQRLFSGGAWAVSGRAMMLVTGFAVNALLARLLPPGDLGLYFLTLSVVSIAAIGAQFGLTQIVVRLVAESLGTGKPGRAGAAIRLTLRLAGIMVIMMAALMVSGGVAWLSEHLFGSRAMSSLAGLMAVWMTLLAFQQIIAEIFRGFHDIRLAVVFGGLGTSIIAMLIFGTVWVIQGGSGLRNVVNISILAGATSLLFSSFVLWGRLKTLANGDTGGLSGADILRMSWPLAVTNVILFGLLQADLWIMGYFRSAAEVAVYGASARVAAIISMPLMMVNAVVPPIIAESYARGEVESLEKTLRLAATLAFLPALLLAGVFLAGGKAILAVIFGDYYGAGSVILAILCLGKLANVMAGSCGQVLMLTGLQKGMMMISVIAGLLSVAGAALLATRYGGIGVASATAGGLLVQNLLMVLYVRRNTGIATHVSLSLGVAWARRWRSKGLEP